MCYQSMPVDYNIELINGERSWSKSNPPKWPWINSSHKYQQTTLNLPPVSWRTPSSYITITIVVTGVVEYNVYSEIPTVCMTQYGLVSRIPMWNWSFLTSGSCIRARQKGRIHEINSCKKFAVLSSPEWVILPKNFNF